MATTLGTPKQTIQGEQLRKEKTPRKWVHAKVSKIKDHEQMIGDSDLFAGFKHLFGRQVAEMKYKGFPEEEEEGKKSWQQKRLKMHRRVVPAEQPRV